MGGIMKKIFALLLIICLVLVVGCGKDKETTEVKTTENEVAIETEEVETEDTNIEELKPAGLEIEDVILKTGDDVNIAATYYPGEGDGIILLHMLNHDRSTYDNFARSLMAEGYSVVSIDLRGHGESDLNWQEFNDHEREEFNDFVNMEADVLAAKKFLNRKGIFVKRIVGASIGANIALRYAANNPEVEKLVLLSPGVNYKGVKISDAATTYAGDVLLIYAKNDEPAADAGERIPSRFLGKYRTLESPGSKHGTELLPEFDNKIIDWL